MYMSDCMCIHVHVVIVQSLFPEFSRSSHIIMCGFKLFSPEWTNTQKWHEVSVSVDSKLAIDLSQQKATRLQTPACTHVWDTKHIIKKLSPKQLSPNSRVPDGADVMYIYYCHNDKRDWNRIIYSPAVDCFALLWLFHACAFLSIPDY